METTTTIQVILHDPPRYNQHPMYFTQKGDVYTARREGDNTYLKVYVPARLTVQMQDGRYMTTEPNTWVAEEVADDILSQRSLGVVAFGKTAREAYVDAASGLWP